MTTANDDAKLSETMAALARGEKPDCPWCGAPCEGFNSNEAVEAWVWACDSEIRGGEEPCERGENCYERELAALREELSASDECLDMVREALAEIDGADSPNTPPMMYPEWIQGVVARKTAALREENARLKDSVYLAESIIRELLEAAEGRIEPHDARLWLSKYSILAVKEDANG